LFSTTATVPNIVVTNVSTGTLNASGTSILANATATNVSTGTLNASTGITTGTINATGLSALTNATATNVSTGTLTASTGITTGTIKVTGTSVLANATATNVSTGTLTASTGITTGTINATGLSALANVTATNVSSGTLTASTGITTGTINATGLSALANATATNVSTGTLTASGLSALANVTATNVSAGVVIASTGITTGTISVSGLSALANVTATNVSAGVVIASTGITTGTISVSGLSALANATATNVSTGTLTASGLSVLANVTATNVSAGTLTASTGITTGTISVSGLSALANATATNVSAGTLTASTGITTGTISVSGTSVLANATATNISAGTLNASTGITAASAQITNENVTTSTIATLRVSSNLLALGNSNTLGNIYTTGGNVGVGTVSPGEALDVRGNLRIGNSSQSNYISFYGTTGDEPGEWSHTYIGERLYGGSEGSELLLFKGNDTNTVSGPDRIRYLSANHLFDTYTSPLSGTFAGVGTSGTTRMIIDLNGNVGINTTSPTANLDVTGTARFTTSVTSGLLSATNIVGNSISAGTLSGTTITGANLSLSGNLIVGGTLTTVNITSTNMLNTNISAGTINATSLSSLQNVTATNISTGTLRATGISVLANVTATGSGSGTNGAVLITGSDSYGHSLYVQAANGKRLVFSNNGSVGNIFSYDYGSNVPQNLSLQGPGGNVGVGTASPAYTLDVAGTGRFAGKLTITGNNGETGFDTATNDQYADMRVIRNSTSSLDKDMYIQNGAGATSTLHMYSDNVETMTLKAGKVGINNTSPNAPLQLSNAITNRKIVLHDVNNNDHEYYGFGVNGSSFRYQVDVVGSSHDFYAGTSTTTSRHLMRIRGDGYIGIGTTSPIASLDVRGDIAISGKLTMSPSDNFSYSGNNVGHYSLSWLMDPAEIGGPMAYLSGYAGIRLFTTGTPRLNILSNGNVGINNVSPAYTLDVAGTGRFTSNLAVIGNVGIGTASPSGMLHLNNAALFTSAGNLTCTGDVVSFGSLSDRRLKKNIETIETAKALDIVSKLRAVSFDWKDDIFNEEKRNTSDLGFIAQEVEELIPEAVSEYTQIESGEVYKNIKHERLVPYLLSAIQYLLSKQA
jgi:hypothetical protein